MKNRGAHPLLSAQNLNRSFRINVPLVEKLGRSILRYVKKESRIDIEVVFLDDKSIRLINKKYLGEDHPTDVISFKIDRREFGAAKPLGEIFISLDTARKNSKRLMTDLRQETVLYLIHGILHLFGYDDLDAASFRRMSKKQDEILDRLCMKENLSKVLTPQ